MSIAARYNDKECVAHCTSADFCEFHINLFSSGGNEPGTIVEVQRRKGCSLAFHRTAWDIIAAAEGEECMENNDSSPLVAVLEEEEDWAKNVTEQKKNALAAMKICANLLLKDRLDANLLGVEFLCLLTDPRKTGIITATLVSRAILTGSIRPINSSKEKEGLCTDISHEEDDVFVQSLNLRKFVLSLIQYKKLSDDDDMYDSEEEVSKCDDVMNDASTDGNRHRRSHDLEHADKLHNLALEALSNALDVIARDGSLCETVHQHQWLGDVALVETLIDVLRKAETRPHDAVLSARCLASLVEASNEAIEHAMKLDAMAVVKRAKLIGQSQHASLALESTNVYDALSSRRISGT